MSIYRYPRPHVYLTLNPHGGKTMDSATHASEDVKMKIELGNHNITNIIMYDDANKVNIKLVLNESELANLAKQILDVIAKES